MEQEKLSTLLENKRHALDLNQEQFAKLLGITQQGYGKWAAGTSTPRPKHMQQVSEVLEISLKEAIQAKIAQQHDILLAKSNIPDEIEPTKVKKEVKTIVRNKTEKLTGYGLLTMLASALENEKLQQHQINTLGSIIDSFNISSNS